MTIAEVSALIDRHGIPHAVIFEREWWDCGEKSAAAQCAEAAPVNEGGVWGPTLAPADPWASMPCR